MARNWYGCAGAAGAPDAHEQAFAARLGTTFGDTVEWLSAAAAVPSDLSAYDGVIFGTSMASNQATKWDAVDIPVISMHLGKFLHAQQASVTFASTGAASTTRGIDTTPARVAYPIGAVTMHSVTPTTGYLWIQDTNVAPNVVVLGRHQNAGTRITGILIPGGTALLNSAVSPASNRAALPVNEYTTLTANAWSILEEVVTWTSPPAAEPPAGSVAHVVTDEVSASAFTGVGTLSYAFTQLSGPTVTLNGTGATRTFTRPDPLTAPIVIRVAVTDDNGTTIEDVTIKGGGTPGQTRYRWTGTAWVLVG